MEEIIISAIGGGGLALALRWAYRRLRHLRQVGKEDLFPPYDPAIDKVSDTAAGRYMEYKRRNNLI